MPENAQFFTTLILIGVIIISLSVHELAHAWVANLLGDSTAKDEGRITLNPGAHWDPIGTTLLVGLMFLRGLGIPIFVFGWGKPVPVNENNFRSPRSDSLKTSLAGPFSNLLLAILLALPFYFLNSIDPILALILITSISVNVFLAVFNLLPIVPLDGSQIIRSLLPEQLYWKFEPYSQVFMIGIFGLIFLFPGFLSTIVGSIVELILP